MKSILLLIVGSFCFLGLGLLVASFMLRFGKGGSGLAFLNSAFALTSGAYFPLRVFSPQVQKICFILSPMTVFLEGVRSLLDGQVNFFPWSNLGILFIWGCVTFPLGLFSFSSSVKSLRISGKRWSFSY